MDNTLSCRVRAKNRARYTSNHVIIFQGPGVVIPIRGAGGGAAAGGQIKQPSQHQQPQREQQSQQQQQQQQQQMTRSVPYFEKESRRRAEEIVAEVAQLEKWRPATPLAAAGKDKDDGGATGAQNTQQTTQQKAK